MYNLGKKMFQKKNASPKINLIGYVNLDMFFVFT